MATDGHFTCLVYRFNDRSLLLCFVYVFFFSSLLLFLFVSGRYVDEVMARGTGFIHLKELGQHERVCSIIRDVNFELRRGCWVAVKLVPPFQFCSYQCIYLLRFIFYEQSNLLD